MESLGTVFAAILWLVAVPVAVFGILKIAGYDWDKPWLMWRTKAGPLPLWVYIAVIASLGVVVIVTAPSR